MYEELRLKNRENAFRYYVQRIKQDPDTVIIEGDNYSFVTKKGIVRRYRAFFSFKEYAKSEYYLSKNKMERVWGFIFVNV